MCEVTVHVLFFSSTVQHIDISTLQEGLHHSGVESLSRWDTVPTSQLISSIQELYSCLHLHCPALASAQLQQAQELCGNWLQMNYQSSTGACAQAASLKVTLCLLTGAKTADKARCEFNSLSNISHVSHDALALAQPSPPTHSCMSSPRRP